MIIAVSLSVIPYYGYAGTGEEGIVATTRRVIPRTVIGGKEEIITFVILFQPIAVLGLGSSLDLCQMRWILVGSTTDHIKIHIGRNIR